MAVRTEPEVEKGQVAQHTLAELGEARRAMPFCEALAVVTEHVRSSPSAASAGVISTIGAVGAVLLTVTLLLVELPVSVPSSAVTVT